MQQRFEEAVPVKTADGAAELASRSRGLSQRHRTVLLLVDGQRPISRVLATAQAAGVQPALFDELVSLGLVEVPAVAHVELPLGPDDAADSSLLPASRSLLPESGWSTWSGEQPEPDGVDRALHEARELLARALRAQAPVSGSLTLLKLKRASTRDEVEALLDEVEQRLRRPHRMIVAAQTMRHVRHLLGLPAPSQR